MNQLTVTPKRIPAVTRTGSPLYAFVDYLSSIVMKLEACRQRDANSMQLAHIDPRTLRVNKIMSRLSIVCALALLVASPWVAAQAAAVHKWVDDKGVIHYSDAAPEASETSVVQLEISTGNRSSSAASESSDHYYSIANQWQRIQQERLQQQQRELQKATLTVTRTTDQGRTDYDDEEPTTRYVAAYPAKFRRRNDYRKRHPLHHRSYTHTRQSNPQPASLGSFPTTN